MDRREFLETFVASLSLAATSTPALAETAKPLAMPQRGLFGLSKIEDPGLQLAAYTASETQTFGSEAPYVYLYFDEEKKAFVSPLNVQPILDPGLFHLKSKLCAFNVSGDVQSRAKTDKSSLQLGFNVTTRPNTADQLTWLFVNAVNLFRRGTVDADKLTTFLNSTGGSGVSLSSAPNVQIVDGTLALQLTAFLQKKEGFWASFINKISHLLNSPAASTVLSGFSLPSLAKDVLLFVDHSLDVLTGNEALTPLWQTGALEFGILKNTQSRFKMRSGLWVTVDHDYAKNSSLLEGHSIDLELQSFRLSDKNKKPVDANYLVTDLKIVAAPPS